MNKKYNRKTERAALRTYFTKTLNSLKLELEKTPIDKVVVLRTTTKLYELMKKSKVYHGIIVDLTSELIDSTERFIYTLIEDNENYSDEYEAVKRKVCECMYSSMYISHHSEPISTVTQNKHYKLLN